MQEANRRAATSRPGARRCQAGPPTTRQDPLEGKPRDIIPVIIEDTQKADGQQTDAGRGEPQRGEVKGGARAGGALGKGVKLMVKKG